MLYGLVRAQIFLDSHVDCTLALTSLILVNHYLRTRVASIVATDTSATHSDSACSVVAEEYALPSFFRALSVRAFTGILSTDV